MLPIQGALQFSEHAVLYDMLIPQGHLLRKINDLIDFQFVLDELKSKYCQDNGRTAENPVRMFKYLLLKTIYTLSDVDVVEHSRYDLSYKYFLGMMPEDNVIDPSTDGVSGKRAVQVFSEGAGITSAEKKIRNGN